MRPELPWFFPASYRGGPKPGWVALFTLPFLVIGLACFWSMSGRPTLDWMRARYWKDAEAVIEKAHVETAPGRDRNRDKLVVRFRYPYDGAVHVGTRPSFVSPDVRLGISGLHQLAESLPVGKRVTCWVNPADPAEAVLDRSLPGQALLGLFFSSTLITVGVIGLVLLALPWLSSFFFERRKAQLARLTADGRLPEWVLQLFAAESPRNEAALIIAGDDRLPQALMMTLLNFFWNGLTGGLVYVDVTFIVAGDRSSAVFLSLILLPFIAVGMRMLWSAVKLWRLMSRPGWVAALRPAPTLEGGGVSFCWTWLEAQHHTQPPQAKLRVVGLAAAWDKELDGRRSVISRKRRAELSDRTAVQKCELELAAVDVPIAEAGREMQLRLPPLPSPQLELAKKADWLPVVVWGGWWVLEVTYRDGAIELAELTKAEKFV